MGKVCKIYGLVCSSQPSRIRYVGQTILPLKVRLGSHIAHSKKQAEHLPVSKWINSKLVKGEEISIVLIQENAIWNKTEIEVIKKFRKKEKNLLNVLSGGQGLFGQKMSARTKKKISAALIGRKKSKKHARQISAAKIGIKFSETHKENLRKSLIGRKMPDGFSKKMSQVLTGNQHRRGQKLSEQTIKKIQLKAKSWWSSMSKQKRKSFVEKRRLAQFGATEGVAA